MSDVQRIPSPRQISGLTGPRVAPSDATQAVSTLLRYGWHKVRDHVRHAYPWIILCGYLAYGLWSSGSAKPAVVAEPVSQAEAILGTWRLAGLQPFEIEFRPGGTVLWRISRKEVRGSYATHESCIKLEFERETLSWDPAIDALDRFAVSGNELLLFASSGESKEAAIYAFKRLDPHRAEDLAAVLPTQ